MPVEYVSAQNFKNETMQGLLAGITFEMFAGTIEYGLFGDSVTYWLLVGTYKPFLYFFSWW